MEVFDRERMVTELDHVRITNLIARARRQESWLTQMPLEELLDSANIVPSRKVAPDVVTMNSHVLIEYLDTGRWADLTLCYPADAQPGLGFVSVLSPVGWSLLGLSAGSTARWTTPNGDEGEAKVLEILFQPESNGDYSM